MSFDIEKAIAHGEKLAEESIQEDIKYLSRYIKSAWKRKQKGVNLTNKTLAKCKLGLKYMDEFDSPTRYCLKDLFYL